MASNMKPNPIAHAIVTLQTNLELNNYPKYTDFETACRQYLTVFQFSELSTFTPEARKKVMDNYQQALQQAEQFISNLQLAEAAKAELTRPLIQLRGAIPPQNAHEDTNAVSAPENQTRTFRAR
jgi:hypothetical protein